MSIKSVYIASSILLSILLGIACYFLLNYWGICTSSDGVWYCNFALEMKHMGNYACVPSVWPPLYSMILSLFLWIDPFPKDAAVLASSLFLSLTVLGIFLFLKEFKIQIGLSIVLVMVLLSSPFIGIFFFSLSEGLFAVLIVWHVYFLTKHWLSKKVIYLILSLLFLGFLPLTRYIGYAFFLVTFLYLLFYGWVEYRFNQRQMVIQFAYSTFLLVVSACFLLVYKYLVHTKSIFGSRANSNTSLGDLIQTLIQDYSLFLALAIILLFILGAVIYVVKKSKQLVSKSPFIPVVGYILCMGIIYLVAILAAKSIYQFDPLNSRLLSPYLFLIVLALVLFLYILPDSLNSWKRHTWFGRHTWLGFLGVYLVSGALILTFSFNLSAFFGDVIRIAESDHAHPYNYGFTHSQTALQMKNVLEDAMENQDTILMGAIMLSAYKNQSPHLAQVYLYSKQIFSGNGWNHFQLGEISPATQTSTQIAKTFNYTVSFQTQDQREQQIRYCVLPLIETMEQLQNEVVLLMHEQGCSHFYCFVSTRGLGGSPTNPFYSDHSYTHPDLKNIEFIQLAAMFHCLHFELNPSN